MMDHTSIPHPRISDIQLMVAERFGSSVREMLSDRRSWPIAHPRQVALFLAAELTAHSLAGIGRLFNRDHTTVIHARSAVRRRMAADRDLADRVAALRTRLIERAEQDAVLVPCGCKDCLIDRAAHPFDPPQIPLPMAWPDELALQSERLAA